MKVWGSRRQNRPQGLRRCVGVFASLVVATTGIASGESGWTASTDLSLKATFDNNVYLQDYEPAPQIANAARPSQESFVTSITPRVTFGFKPCVGFTVSGSYAPEIVTYHQESGESHVAHRGSMQFGGVVGKVTWQLQNSVTWIDGSEEGLTFGGPGGAPAIGGIPLRDRREAVFFRNSFGAFHKHGRWFFRPAASSYVHDFRTTERDPAKFPYYQNYVDRNDVNVGLDAGFKAFKDGYLFVAYRFGWQHEPSLPQVSYDYSNNYRRLLLGFEGRVTERLKLNLFVGPDWRDFNHRPPADFDRTPRKVFIDGTAVFTVTAADSVTITVKRFEQPAFGAPSAYEDITYEILWRRNFRERFTFAAGFKAYGGVWEPPVMREDWIYTPSASLTFKRDKKLTLDIAWSWDRARSSIPDKQGRDFTRQLVSLGAKYSF
ncbi:MAG TPA: hypothetical protein VMM36_03340 [Opitutaceae bacterium]|nr:hypothetical protein [Opitutaceae bacterium]